MSAPFFPPPDPFRTSARPSEAPAATPRAVVQRPEPTRDAASPVPAAGKPKLTQEEIAALLAVSSSAGSRQDEGGPKKWNPRRAVVLVPIGLIDLLLDFVFDDAAMTMRWALSIALFVGGLVYVLAPLFRQKRDGWV